jgi:hypothetical protein
MAVYVFPVNAAKAASLEINAGIVDAAVKALDLTIIRDVKGTYRETATKYYEDEVEKGNSLIIVDSSLPFEADDIAPDFSFGNGTTIGAVRLKTGQWIQCGWVVFKHADKTEVDAKLPQLKNIFLPS